jgi:protein-S-isoprenylcysteine O-methyltransferase Ste14
MTDLQTETFKLEELVEAYYVTKTGFAPTPSQLAALVSEIDDETRDKVMKLHYESEFEQKKQEKNESFVNGYQSASNKSCQQAWLIAAGVMIGLISAYVGQLQNNQRAELFTIDRKPQESEFQKATMYVLVCVGFLFAIRRYWYLTLNPFKPQTKIETRMGLCLIINVICLFRFWLMVSSVKRNVPWWEALVTGFGMTALQPLFMGLCALPIYQKRESAKERSDVAVLLVDICCVLIACGGVLLSTLSEHERSVFITKFPNTLYTGGAFQYARHINYTGEVILFGGWSLLTRSKQALLVPFFFFMTFHVLYAPDLDIYLEGKYGASYVAWVEKTPW